VTFSVADEVLVATTLFLGVVAIFGPAYADKFKAWLLRPVLRIEFRLSPPDCHLTDSILVLSPGQKSKEPIYFYRLRVTNIGKTQARKCEIVIEGLAIANEAGRFQPYPTYTPVRLVWGSGNGEFVDINPGRQLFCDFVSIPNAASQKVYRDLYGIYVDLKYAPPYDLGIVLNVNAAFFSQPNRLPQGRYRLDVAVYSENADKASQSLFVSWSGAWKSQEHEMFRECVISTREEDARRAWDRPFTPSPVEGG